MSFQQSPFNPVDALIFSQVSYLPLDNIVSSPVRDSEISISAAANIFAKKLEKKALGGYVMFKDDPEFFKTLGRSNRFCDCILHSYANYIDEEQEKQFAAVCTHTGTATFVSYRGTDASLVGWKEDMNMSFNDAVPSQLEAVEYLETAARNTSGPLLIGGHSKGGNLAVYAASSCTKKTRKRIKNIYSFDAPGFHQRLIASSGFSEIRDRINLYIPQSSVIGLLFEHGKDSIIIKSTGSGFLQHDPYSWELAYNDLVRLDALTQGSRFMDKTIREWMAGMDYQRRHEFIEALFTILSATQAKSLVDLGSDWFNSAGRMIQGLGNIDNSTKKIVTKTIAALFGAAKNNFDTLLEPHNALRSDARSGARSDAHNDANDARNAPKIKNKHQAGENN